MIHTPSSLCVIPAKAGIQILHSLLDASRSLPRATSRGWHDKVFLTGLSVLLISFCAPAFAKDTNAILHNSGQPIPRFVALKSNEVNMRVGPGERYPIAWVYHRKNWPVEVIEEFGHWRKIRDYEGTGGWVHKTLLAGTRSAIILKDRTPLLSSPDESSAILVQVDPLVAGVIQECSPNWCRLMFNQTIGWVQRSKLWGIYPNEDLSEK